jgi:hypothetical protein
MRGKPDWMCERYDCEEPAAFRIHWPAGVPPAKMCPLCAFRMQRLARLGGFNVLIELLGPLRMGQGATS